MSVTTTDRPPARRSPAGPPAEPMRRASYALILSTGPPRSSGCCSGPSPPAGSAPPRWGSAPRWSRRAVCWPTSPPSGLRNGLVRFLPEAGASAAPAGRRARTPSARPPPSRWLGGVRARPTAVGPGAGAAADQPAGRRGLLRRHRGLVLFVLQDNVLTGLHRTGWVPVSNVLSSVAKIGLLPVLGMLALGTGWAIFTASVLPYRGSRPVVTASCSEASRPPTARDTAGPDGPADPVRGHRPRRRPALDGHGQRAHPDGAAAARPGGQRVLLHGQHHRLRPVPGHQQHQQRAGRRGRTLPRPGCRPWSGPRCATPRCWCCRPSPWACCSPVRCSACSVSDYAASATRAAPAAAALRRTPGGDRDRAGRRPAPAGPADRSCSPTLALAVTTYGGSWLGLGRLGPVRGRHRLPGQPDRGRACGCWSTGRSGLGGPRRPAPRSRAARAWGPALAALRAVDLPAHTPAPAARLRLRRPGGRRRPAERAGGAEDRHLGGGHRRSGPARRMLAGCGGRPAGVALVPRSIVRRTLGRRPAAARDPAAGHGRRPLRRRRQRWTPIAALHRATATSTLVGPACCEPGSTSRCAGSAGCRPARRPGAGSDRLAARCTGALAEQAADHRHRTATSGPATCWSPTAGPVMPASWTGRTPGRPACRTSTWCTGGWPPSRSSSAPLSGRALADPADARRGADGSCPYLCPTRTRRVETVVLLTWLGHVAGGLSRAVPPPLSPRSGPPATSARWSALRSSGSSDASPIDDADRRAAGRIPTGRVPTASRRGPDRPAGSGRRTRRPWWRPPPYGPGARLDYWLAGVPVVAAALWVMSFLGVDPRTMGELGLLRCSRR